MVNRDAVRRRVAAMRYGYSRAVSWVSVAVTVLLIVRDGLVLRSGVAPHQMQFLYLHVGLLVGSLFAAVVLTTRRRLDPGYSASRIWCEAGVGVFTLSALAYAVGSTWADVSHVGTIAGFIIIMIVLAVTAAWRWPIAVVVFGAGYAGFLGVVLSADLTEAVRESSLVNGTVAIVVSISVSVLQNRSRTKGIRAHLRAEESNDLLTRVTDNMFDMVFLMDAAGKATFISGSHSQLGYDPDDLVGLNVFDLVHPEDVANTAELFEASKRGAEANTAQCRVRRSDESYAWVEVAWTLLCDSDGTVSEALVSSRDITHRRRAEQELLRTKEEALAASKAKSAFLANMSHEIRTPLNGVIGFLQLLSDSRLGDTQRGYVAHADASARALLEIINDILDLSKIEAGKLELELVQTDIHRLSEECVGIVAFATAEKGLELLLRIAPDVPALATVDPVRLKQILANLLSNAVKFTPTGEIELSVEFRRIGDARGIFVFAVRDTGIGITPAQRGRLFEAFSQGDSSTTREFGGTGLGLAISDTLARKMGGKIELESTPGVGSVFSFALEADYDTPTARTPPRGVSRLLAVDSHPRTREILAEVLCSWGIEVVSTADASSAVAFLQRDGPFDAAIIGGRSMLQEIERAVDPQSLAPVILVEGPLPAPDPAGSQIVGTVLKPITPNALLRRLEDLGSNTPGRAKSDSAREDPVMPKRLLSRFTICVADDDATNMFLIRTFLSRIAPNATVRTAGDGAAAVEIVTSTTIDIVLMDVQMPVLDGLEATRRIREWEKSSDRRVPIVALTAGALPQERDRCREAGMDDFMSKPVELERLTEAIGTHLPRRTAE